MKRILLYGMYGAVNLGDELVCRAVVEGVRRVLPDYRPCIMSMDREKSLRFTPLPETEVYQGAGFHYTFWLHPFRNLAVFKQIDAVVIGGGGLFQDQYSWRLPASSLLNALMGLIHGKPVYVIGVGVGPVRRKWLRKLIGQVLSRVDLLCVRDEKSRQELIECGVPAERINVTADVVPSMIMNKKVPQAESNQQFQTVAFILRDWEGINYSAVAALIDRLAQQGCRIQLHGFEPRMDKEFYDKIAALCSPATIDSIEWVIPQTLQQSLDAIQRADMVISMRLHGCILACIFGIPLIPVAYERKIKALAEQIGLEYFVKNTNDLNVDLVGHIETAKRYYAENSEKSQKRWRVICDRSEENYILLQRVMNCDNMPVRQRHIKGVLLRLLCCGFIGEAGHVINYLKKHFQAIKWEKI